MKSRYVYIDTCTERWLKYSEALINNFFKILKYFKVLKN